MHGRLQRFSGVPLAAVAVSVLGGCFTYSQSDPRVKTLKRISYTVEQIDPECSISAIVAGDPTGQRVIYVHGTPGSAESWGLFLTEPIDGLDAVAIDRPGFGESATTGAVPSLVEQAEAIEPLLVEHDGRWPILVGHSLGGPIVAQVAADYPDRVGGIVIVAGALDPDLEKVLLIQRIGNIPFLDLLVPTPLRNANRELIPLEGELRKLGDHLDEITCPIVIIHGTKDSLVPYENVAYMREAFAGNPDVTVITLEGEDHFTIWTSADRVREAIETLVGNRGAEMLDDANTDLHVGMSRMPR